MITAIHGDGARRIKYEYRPTTWISHGIQAACGIQYHKILANGGVRAGLYYRGWRYSVQQFCFRIERFSRRWI
jgi:hypothetical protein